VLELCFSVSGARQRSALGIVSIGGANFRHLSAQLQLGSCLPALHKTTQRAASTAATCHELQCRWIFGTSKGSPSVQMETCSPLVVLRSSQVAYAARGLEPLEGVLHLVIAAEDEHRGVPRQPEHLLPHLLRHLQIDMYICQA